MIKKAYQITIARETEKEGYLPNRRSITILAETGLGAIRKVKLEDDEFIDEIKNLAVMEVE